MANSNKKCFRIFVFLFFKSHLPLISLPGIPPPTPTPYTHNGECLSGAVVTRRGQTYCI